MKKLVIVLLAAMLLFSLTSCKDKSEEMIATYEEFCSVVTFGSDLKYVLGMSDGNINDVTTDNIATFVNYFSGSEIKVTSKSKQTGTVVKDQTEDKSKTTITWKDVVIDYKYTEGSDTTEKDGKLTVSGTYEWEDVSNRAVTAPTAYRYNYTINGTSYSANYTIDSGVYTVASVNGKDVNRRILNAGK